MRECETEIISPGHILEQSLVNFSEVLLPDSLQLQIHYFNIKIYSISIIKIIEINIIKNSLNSF